MAEAQVLLERLMASQNPDGGWPYHKGTSWAEPTAFAVLALQSGQDSSIQPVLHRGISWLLARQTASGGWAPNANVPECTSVTSIATLAILPFAIRNNPQRLDAALTWTANQVYPDDFSLGLLLARALNLPPAHAPGSVAWYPGTAGWVTPTALSTLTLLRAARETGRPALQTIAARSCVYLLSRRCVDNGWNHGGSKTRSEDATSYPETTGLALLALRAASISQPDLSVALARQFILAPESTEGLSWLQMAIHSPGRPAPDPAVLPVPRTNRDIALRILSLAAKRGKNLFLAA